MESDHMPGPKTHQAVRQMALSYLNTTIPMAYEHLWVENF